MFISTLVVICILVDKTHIFLPCYGAKVIFGVLFQESISIFSRWGFPKLLFLTLHRTYFSLVCYFNATTCNGNSFYCCWLVCYFKLRVISKIDDGKTPLFLCFTTNRSVSGDTTKPSVFKQFSTRTYQKTWTIDERLFQRGAIS